ncbi:MAG TPA: YXWGXW repeat-containing protein, partial [Puia sp.]|nr:YXWGXW repeat-containing protein [Puia sp.]
MKKTIFLFILILTGLAVTVGRADAQVFSVGISLRVGPPVIPVYTQPPCPVDGYIWIPGYWAYDDDYGYYWVPGYWAEPPEIGFLWTPGYWACSDGIYAWHPGYWGPHIGFYGGVDYGCGYYGNGYVGGGWVGGRFRYNTAVTNVNTTVVRNVYVDRTVVRHTTVNRVSYNGGPGGIHARPSAAQAEAMRDRHVQATSAQMSQQHNASIDRNQFASVNRGRPEHLAVARPTAYRPVNTRANLSRAPMGRPGEVNERPQPSREVGRPQPMRQQPAREVGRP